MKKTWFIISLILTFFLEACICTYLFQRTDYLEQDTVLINQCLKSVEGSFITEGMNTDSSNFDTSLLYTVLDMQGNIIYQPNSELSSSINEAIKNRDTILDIVVDDRIVGKIIFHNEMYEQVGQEKEHLLRIIVGIIFLQILYILIYVLYLQKSILEPFRTLNQFAVRVAGGNLDIPLDVDKKHVFGSFTEAFDLMRSELKKARAAEKKANDDKKEMVAKLSHDIKTPIASIKSTSEIGFELTKEERPKELFNLINVKTDQITTLVDNLFLTSVQDVTEIAVNPSRYESGELTKLIKNADYLEKASGFQIPECQIYIDKLRMQQTLDNIFMNSYKYANTDVTVLAELKDEYLVISIADAGEGVKEEEIPLLKEKYKRGSNISEKERAGLGLYLADYFMTKMGGKLVLENKNPGFAVTLYLRTI